MVGPIKWQKETTSRGRALTLAVEHGVDDFYQGVVPALVPLLVTLRGYDYSRAGGIVLAATLLSSLAQPLFGLLADRRPMPAVRTMGMLTAGTGIALVGVVDSYVATWCVVLVSGVGVAAYHPEASRAVNATGTAERGMSWFVFGGLVGFAAGPPVTAVLLGGLGLGASPLLVLPAVVMAGVTCVTALRRGRSSPGTPVGSTPSREDDAGPAADDWRRFGWLTAVVAVRSVLYYGITLLVVAHLVGHLDASRGVGDAALTAFTGVGALSVLVAGRVTGRIGRVRTVVGCYALAAVGLAVVVLTPSPTSAVVVCGVVGAALNVPVPVQATLGQAFLPAHVGLASAVTLGLAASAGGLAAPVLGRLADQHGATLVLGASVVLPVLAAVLALPLRKGITT